MINHQNRSRVFLVIILILFITNMAMLIFLLGQKASTRQAKRPDKKTFITNFLQKEIGFDQQQLLRYDTLSNRHHDKTSSLYEQVRSNKVRHFKYLTALNFSDSAINAVSDQSAASQKIIEAEMFNHIKNIRLLCTTAQEPRFDSLFVKVFNRRGEGRKKLPNKK